MKNINVIKNFISLDYCQEIVDKFSKKIWDSPDPLIKSGFSISESQSIEYFYSDKNDFLNKIFKKMSLALFKEYNKEVELKSMFHSIMTPGAKNPLHWDNYIENGEEDISTLLYLNKNFTGGDLFFPNQNIRISPEPGMFVFFQGTQEYVHTVEKVISGERHALVGFFWPVDKRKSIK